MVKLAFDPTDREQLINYNRTDRELEVFLLFSILVAGKRADLTAKLLTNMFAHRPQDSLLRPYLKRLGETRRRQLLEKHRTGQYGRIAAAFTGILDLPLRTVTVPELVAIPGIGPKTARFFVLFSREDAACAVLDTHILKYLRAHEIAAPKTTPQSQALYNKLELQWLSLVANEFPDHTVAEADFEIWKSYTKANL